MSGAAWHSFKQPENILPVAPYPAMQSLQIRQYTGRTLVRHFYIRHIGRAEIAAFKYIVAEYSLVGESLIETAVVGFGVDKSFAGEYTLTVQILINVAGDRVVSGNSA